MKTEAEIQQINHKIHFAPRWKKWYLKAKYFDDLQAYAMRALSVSRRETATANKRLLDTGSDLRELKTVCHNACGKIGYIRTFILANQYKLGDAPISECDELIGILDKAKK